MYTLTTGDGHGVLEAPVPLDAVVVVAVMVEVFGASENGLVIHM